MTERPSTHVEDPTIEQLAAAAGRTDEIAVRRQLFGWRELISTVIPVLLIGYFARNVDWSQAFGTLRRADPLFVVAALVVYYLSFPVRAIRWARLLREGGTRIARSASDTAMSPRLNAPHRSVRCAQCAGKGCRRRRSPRTR